MVLRPKSRGDSNDSSTAQVPDSLYLGRVSPRTAGTTSALKTQGLYQMLPKRLPARRKSRPSRTTSTSTEVVNIYHEQKTTTTTYRSSSTCTSEDINDEDDDDDVFAPIEVEDDLAIHHKKPRKATPPREKQREPSYEIHSPQDFLACISSLTKFMQQRQRKPNDDLFSHVARINLQLDLLETTIRRFEAKLESDTAESREQLRTELKKVDELYRDIFELECCAVCMDGPPNREMATLECQHSFCTSCIYALCHVALDAQQETVKCPLCRAIHQSELPTFEKDWEPGDD